MHGDRRRNWREFERNASGLASALADHGVRRGDTFAQYLYNGVEYLESIFAAFKGGFVPVNTNYRYRDDDDGYGGDDRYRWRGGSSDWDGSRYYREDPNYEERRLTAEDEVYRGSDGRYYCRRSDGTTGLVIGAGVGALVGRGIDSRGERTTGTVIGGVLGALVGREVERGQDLRCR